jgi:hypothetical protein
MTNNLADQPAFPHMGDIRHNPDFLTEQGMTLRQYFAGQAMMGYLASCEGNELAIADIMAKYSVEYADALIAELSKPKQ